MTTTWRNHMSTTFGTQSCGLQSTLDQGTSCDCIPPTSYKRTDAPAGHPHPVPCHLVVGPSERVELSLTIFAFTFHLIEKEKDVCLLLCPLGQRTLSSTSQTRRSSVHRRGSSAHVLSRQSFTLSSFADRCPSHGILTCPFSFSWPQKQRSFCFFSKFSQSRVLVNAG